MAGNLCNKCPSGYSNKTAVKVILSMRSLVSIEQQSPRRPCDILWPMLGQRLLKLLKLPKLPKLPNVSKKCAKLKMFKTALPGVSQQSSCQGVCQSVVPASPGLFRPRGLAQPCPAFPSLLQLTPARSGPRSLAQLSRGPGRVPIIQGASQRSYRAQEP